MTANPAGDLSHEEFRRLGKSFVLFSQPLNTAQVRYSSTMMRLALLLLAVVGWAQTPLSPTDLNRVVPGTVAPDFELPTVGGGKLKLSSLRGRNVVLVFYRGYW